jgi:predicted membrane-bound mannosyltransferase/DNA-binding beta-propeller fold protein YncE
MHDKRERPWLDRPVLEGLPLTWEHAIYLTIAVVCLVSRLSMLGYRVQTHDESLHTQYSWYIYSGRSYIHNPMMHGPFLFHATALSYALFGDSDFTARLPVALIGTALVLFPYVLRRYLGRKGALIASFLFLISPSIMYYSRYIRMDVPTILWAMIIVWAVFHYLEEGKDWHLYVLAGALSLMYATKEVAPIYTIFFAIFLVGLFLVRALRRPWQHPEFERWFVGALLAIAAGIIVLGLGVIIRSDVPADVAGEVVEPAGMPAWAVLGGIVAVLGAVAAIVTLLRGLGEQLREFRSFDLIVLVGTLSLPFASPIAISLFSRLGGAIAGPDSTLATLDLLNYRAPDLYYSGAILALVIAAAVGIGLVWDRRRWPIAAAIYGVIFLVLFTSVFTNGQGIVSGWIGSVGYWLPQQEVERGSQPWYYYFVVLPFYEFLPLLGALGTMGFLGFQRLVNEIRHRNDGSPRPERGAPFIPFIALWIVLAWIGFSYAGERMAWLTVHIATPMILITGWMLGRVLDTIDWRLIWREKGWLLTILVPLLIAALVATGRALGQGPFGGIDVGALTITGAFVAGVAGVLVIGTLATLLWMRIGDRHAGLLLVLTAFLILGLLTVRVAWRFSFVNFDRPAELLVYAHNGPDVRTAIEQLEELSLRVGDGPQSIDVTYNLDKNSFLLYWYFRDYPNARFYPDEPSRDQVLARAVIAAQPQWSVVEPYLGDNYHVFDYTHYWWPMEDYRELTWGKLWDWLTDPQKRRALWHLFYDMDYSLYDQITGRQHVIDSWPLHQEFRLYVRKDVAWEVWGLGTGEIEATAPDVPQTYVDGWQELTARQVWGSEGSGLGQLTWPRGIAVSEDGLVYVADSQNHRIQVFDADGLLVSSWGAYGDCGVQVPLPGTFCEPWDVAVGPEGDVFVADTWAHRVQRFTSEGEFVTAWGAYGQFGIGEVPGPIAFYGPRSVDVGPDGLVYVSDTGNKKVQVFTRDGEFVAEWGGFGAVPGQLDEPVGLAFNPAGQIVIADSWNRRVQVLEPDGAPVLSWPIDGWAGETIDDKPYVAVDAAGRVYVTDPGNYRVLVFDAEGDYLYSFGQFGFDESSFSLPTGVDIGPDGAIYVTDSANHRVMVFDPPQ